MNSVESLWADFATPIVTADDYVKSLRGRGMNVFFMGERVPEPVDHPVIRPSVNAMAETYRIASERPELATARSEIAGLAVNRFLHVPTSPGDLVAKHEMQRELGRRTGTCFQKPAWRGLAAGPTNPDRARDEARRQEGACAPPGRHQRAGEIGRLTPFCPRLR